MSVRYKVWPFRKFDGCYDCDAVQRIEVCPSAVPTILTGEEFIALERAASKNRYSEYVFLYLLEGSDEDRAQKSLRALIESGQALIDGEKERERIKLEKAEAKKQKDALETALKAKKAEVDERKKYEELEKKYGKGLKQ